MTLAQDLEVALSLLRGHNKEHAKKLLRDHSLPVSGNWDELVYRLRASVSKGTVSLDEIVATLDSIEEYGHQHVFLYDMPQARRVELSVRRVKGLAEQEGFGNVFNVRTRIVDLPQKLICTSIRHDGAQLRLKWVERRVWEEPLESGDRVEGSVRWRGFKQHEARAVNTLRINLTTGATELRISNAGKQSRRDYTQRQADYASLTDWLLDWDVLERVSILHAIPRVQQALDEVSVRGTVYLTAQGVKASFTSPATGLDVRDDPVYQAGYNVARREGQDHRLLNVKWLPKDGTPLRESEIHIYLYADGLGNEVRFPADCNEEEDRYVLSRIRHFARP